MWFSPDATHMPSGLVVYPFYDSAMFIAYLSTVPAMAMFLFHSETRFYEHYSSFYRDIEHKASYAKIEHNHKAMVRSIFGSTGYFFLLQGCIVGLAALFAPIIVQLLNSDYLLVGMLRFGLIGAMFQVLTMFILVLLSYSDARRESLMIQVCFLVTNAALTFVSLQAGFSFYGYGYFLSTIITFLFALALLMRYFAKLPYHCFITTNASIR
jgi:uncharacterized membrane protein